MRGDVFAGRNEAVAAVQTVVLLSCLEISHEKTVS